MDYCGLKLRASGLMEAAAIDFFNELFWKGIFGFLNETKNNDCSKVRKAP